MSENNTFFKELLDVAKSPGTKNASFDRVKRSAIANPSQFLTLWQALIDEKARSGMIDETLKLFSLRIKEIDSWDNTLCLSRYDDVACDLNGALTNGHRELVLKALSVNLAPTNFQALFENKNADKKLKEAIVTSWRIFDDFECDEYLSSLE